MLYLCFYVPTEYLRTVYFVIHFTFRQLVLHFTKIHFCSNFLTMLTLSQQALVFTCLQYKSFENTAGKGEIAREEQFLLVPQCFLPISKPFGHFHQIWNSHLQTLSVWEQVKLRQFTKKAIKYFNNPGKKGFLEIIQAVGKYMIFSYFKIFSTHSFLLLVKLAFGERDIVVTMIVRCMCVRQCMPACVCLSNQICTDHDFYNCGWISK